MVESKKEDAKNYRPDSALSDEIFTDKNYREKIRLVKEQKAEIDAEIVISAIYHLIEIYMEEQKNPTMEDTKTLLLNILIDLSVLRHHTVMAIIDQPDKQYYQ